MIRRVNLLALTAATLTGMFPALLSAAPLTLGSSATDFTQSGFNIANTIDGSGVRGTALSGAGWAVNNGGATFQAVYQTTTDVSPINGNLKFDIYHFFTTNTFTLGRYRIYVTDSPRNTFANSGSGGNSVGGEAVGTANWSLFTPTSVVGDANGYSFGVNPDGIGSQDINIGASPNNTGRYTILGQTDLTNITGIRLEALTQTTGFPLPSTGPGLAGNGNFVMTEFQAYDSPGTFVAHRLISADQLETRDLAYAGNLGNGGGDQFVTDSFGRSITFTDNTAGVVTAHSNGFLSSGISNGGLNTVLDPLGFINPSGQIGGTITGLDAETEYRVQLLFNGTGQAPRMSNIIVNGQTLENYEIPNGSSIVTARVRTGVGQTSLAFNVDTAAGGNPVILSAVAANAIPQNYLIDERFDDQNYAVNVLGTGAGWDTQIQNAGSAFELDGAMRLVTRTGSAIESMTSNETVDFFGAGGVRVGFEIENVNNSGFSRSYVGLISADDNPDATFTHPFLVDDAGIFLQLTNTDNLFSGGTGGALLVDNNGEGSPTVLESWNWASLGIDVTQPFTAEIFADDQGYELYFNGAGVAAFVGEWNGYFAAADWLSGARIFANYQGSDGTILEIGAITAQQSAAVPESGTLYLWALGLASILVCQAKWRLRAGKQ